MLENDEPVKLYAVKKHFKVLTEGPSDLFFDAEPEEKEQDEEEAPAIPLEVFEITGQPVRDEHDIAVVSGHLQVDDDNVSAPKSVPAGGEQVSDIFATSWSHNGMCYRNMMNVQNVNPWVAFPHDVKPTLVQLFSVLFPKGYIESTHLSKMNELILGDKVEYGEFLRWLGLWFLMSTTIQGPQRRDFWSTTEINEYEGAGCAYPQFHCHGCSVRVCTYCICTPGIIRCKQCFAQHCVDVEIK